VYGVLICQPAHLVTKYNSRSPNANKSVRQGRLSVEWTLVKVQTTKSTFRTMIPAHQLHFGPALAAARRRKGYRQGELAKLADIDGSYLAALENGRRAAPSRRLQERLYEALGLDPVERARLQYKATVSQFILELNACEPGADFDALRETFLALLVLGSRDRRLVADVGKAVAANAAIPEEVQVMT
jgi:transcriptional regulator with XRE-family HTH domain